MLYAENAVECLKHDPKNANQGLENFSLHSWEPKRIIVSRFGSNINPLIMFVIFFKYVVFY